MNKFSTETENHSTMSNFIEKSSFCFSCHNVLSQHLVGTYPVVAGEDRFFILHYSLDPLPTCQDVVPTNRDEG